MLCTGLSTHLGALGQLVHEHPQPTRHDLAAQPGTGDHVGLASHHERPALDDFGFTSTMAELGVTRSSFRDVHLGPVAMKWPWLDSWRAATPSRRAPARYNHV